MPAVARFATPLPGRLEWHPAHRDPGTGDPEAFHLHIELVNAHRLLQGQFTTSSTCNQPEPGAGRSGGGTGARSS